MATCKDCKRAVVEVTLGTETLLVDMGPRTFTAVRDDCLVFPVDGMAVYESISMVEHSAVCGRRTWAQKQPPQQRKVA